jgi:hypothetical protein
MPEVEMKVRSISKVRGTIVVDFTLINNTDSTRYVDVLSDWWLKGRVKSGKRFAFGRGVGPLKRVGWMELPPGELVPFGVDFLNNPHDPAQFAEYTLEYVLRTQYQGVRPGPTRLVGVGPSGAPVPAEE